MLLFHHGGRFGHDGWWPGFFSSIVPALFLLALVGIAVWAIARLTARGPIPGSASMAVAPMPRRDAALEEVRIRYARGEIDREEYLQRSHDLGAIESEPGPPLAAHGG